MSPIVLLILLTQMREQYDAQAAQDAAGQADQGNQAKSAPEPIQPQPRGRMTQLPPPAPGTYRDQVDHDGTKVGLVNAMIARLAAAPPGTHSISSIWDGELVVVTADQALTATRN